MFGGFSGGRRTGFGPQFETDDFGPPPVSLDIKATVTASLADVAANLASRREQVLDTRPAGRFDGSEPEFRAGVRSGHIPGSRNVPFTDLAAPDGSMLPPDALRARLEAAGVRLDRPVVACCGSGTSACSAVLALHLLGHREVAVYDGSWTEWGGRTDTPVETGPAR